MKSKRGFLANAEHAMVFQVAVAELHHGRLTIRATSTAGELTVKNLPLGEDDEIESLVGGEWQADRAHRQPSIVGTGRLVWHGEEWTAMVQHACCTDCHLHTQTAVIDVTLICETLTGSRRVELSGFFVCHVQPHLQLFAG